MKILAVVFGLLFVVVSFSATAGEHNLRVKELQKDLTELGYEPMKMRLIYLPIFFLGSLLAQNSVHGGQSKSNAERGNATVAAIEAIGLKYQLHQNDGECNKNRGLRGWYFPGDRSVHLCARNVETSGHATIIFIQQIARAAQHCRGGLIEKQTDLEHYVNHPGFPWDVVEVQELYPPEQRAFEAEARRVSYSITQELAVEMLRKACTR